MLLNLEWFKSPFSSSVIGDCAPTLVEVLAGLHRIVKVKARSIEIFRETRVLRFRAARCVLRLNEERRFGGLARVNGRANNRACARFQSRCQLRFVATATSFSVEVGVYVLCER